MSPPHHPGAPSWLAAVLRPEPLEGASGELRLPAGCRRRLGSTRLAVPGALPLSLRPSGGFGLPGGAGSSACLRVGADLLATAGADALRLHDVADGRLLARFRLAGALHLVAASSDPALLAVVLRRAERRRDPALGSYLRIRHHLLALDPASGAVTEAGPPLDLEPRHLVASPDGRYLAVAPPDGAIEVRHLPDGAALGRVSLPLPLDRVGFSADGAWLEARASGNPNPFAELNDATPWECHRGRWQLPSLAGEATVEAYHPEARRPPVEELAEVEGWRREHGLGDLPVRGSAWLAVDPSGRWLALAGHRVDLPAGRFHRLAPTRQAKAEPCLLGFRRHPPALIRGLTSGELEVLPLDDEAPVMARRVPLRGEVATLSPDGEWFATWPGPGRSSLYLSRVDGDAELRIEPSVSRLPRGLGFSPDGSLLAVAFEGGELSLRELPGGSLRGPPARGGPQDPHRLAWCPDGSLLAVAGRDAAGAAQVGLLRVGEAEVRELGPPLEAVGVALAWTPDGRLLLVGDEEGMIRARDLRRDHWLGPVEGDPGAILALAPHPDGETLCAAHQDGTVLEWDLADLRRRLGCHDED